METFREEPGGARLCGKVAEPGLEFLRSQRMAEKENGADMRR